MNFPLNKAREFKLKNDQTVDPILQRDDRYVKFLFIKYLI
jgi:hypothetical protein